MMHLTTILTLIFSTITTSDFLLMTTPILIMIVSLQNLIHRQELKSRN